MNCRRKEKTHMLVAGCVVAILFGIAVSAHGVTDNQQKQGAEMNLTEAQKVLHEKLCEKHSEIEKLHSAFVEDLSADQIAYLKKMGHGSKSKHAHYTGEDLHKMAAGMKLSDAQMAIHNKMAAQMEEIERLHAAFEKTLSTKQRALLKKMGHGSTHRHGTNSTR